MSETLTPEVVAWLMETQTVQEFPDVRDLFVRPAWVRQAACAGKPVELFFPARGASATMPRVRELCAGCPVRDECLEYANTTVDTMGVWGGTTERERRAVRVDAATTTRLQLPA